MVKNMKLKTDHIKEKAKVFSFCEPAEFFPALKGMEQSGECSFTGPVQVDCNAFFEFRHYRVDGSVQTSANLTCSRCLQSFHHKIDSSFTIFFSQGTELQTEEDELELDVQDLITATFCGDEIDLAPEVSDQIALAVPLKPLCSDNCKGLCVSCGTDLNQASCQCQAVEKESKFAALKDFKVRS